MAYDFNSAPVKAWFADTSETYAVQAVSQWTLKPEFQNKAGVEKLRELMTGATAASKKEKGSVYYTFSRSLWDRYAFWCEEQWATKQDFQKHVSPQGAFGKVWGNFTALTTSQVAFFEYDEIFPTTTLAQEELPAPSMPEERRLALSTEFLEGLPDVLGQLLHPAADLECCDGLEEMPTTCTSMNVAFTDPRFVAWNKSKKGLHSYPVNIVTKWTVKNQTAEGLAAWMDLMKKAQDLSRKEPGCDQYQFGRDPFNKYSFWLFEKWATKAQEIVHVTTGAFGQTKDQFLGMSDVLFAAFNGKQIKAKSLTWP